MKSVKFFAAGAPAILPLFAVVVISFLAIGTTASAQSTFTWSGGGGNLQWNSINNWTNGAAPASGSTNTFVFAGVAKPTNDNTVNNLTINALLFSTNAAAFVLRGNAVSLIGGITNNSANTQTINLAAITNNITNTIDAASNNIVINAAIVGTGGITKAGAVTLLLGTNHSYSGATTISGGTLLLSNAGTISTNALNLSASGATLNISNITAPTVNVASFTGATGSTVSLGSKNMSFGGNNASTTFAGAITGSGNLTKNGTGTTTLSGANTYTGSAIVSAGTLKLENATGSALGSITNVSVSTNAILLVAQSDQVNNSAAVTLSGGTIRRGGNVSEVFGNLNLTTGSFLDYGAANDPGTIRFGTYTPSSLLTVQNFLPGNKLQFGNTISSTDLNNAALFSFSSPWTTSTEGGFFTITAIPEPSTVLAAVGLVGLMLWPSRRRLIKDAKRVLGLRAPRRDRLAALRDS
ncbi:MAG: beta strand repeat-containing protein [Chthoniobacterales bacterium]